MFGVTAIAASVSLLFPVAAAPPPAEVCGLSAVYPAFVRAWCGERVPGRFEEFRQAFADYRAASEEAFQAEFRVEKALPYTCNDGAGNYHPANAVEVDIIMIPFDQTVGPALDRASNAWNRMLAAQAQAFAGNPDAIGLSVDVEMLKQVLGGVGRAKIHLQSASEAYRMAQTDEACAAAGADDSAGLEYRTASSLQYTLVHAIESVLEKTQEACSGVTVVKPMSPKQIQQKAGAKDTETTKSGGASLMFPTTLDVGKKPVKLPVTVKSPAAGYGTIRVTRGSKGIVATGGDVKSGRFGLLMTIPGKTKTGKVTIAFAGEHGTVKAKIKFV